MGARPLSKGVFGQRWQRCVFDAAGPQLFRQAHNRTQGHHPVNQRLGLDPEAIIERSISRGIVSDHVGQHDGNRLSVCEVIAGRQWVRARVGSPKHRRFDRRAGKMSAYQHIPGSLVVARVIVITLERTLQRRHASRANSLETGVRVFVT